MTFGLLLNPNFVSHFFRQTVFTISRKWSEGFDPFKESSNFEILLFSLSGLLWASATYNVEVNPCLVELLSLTFDFLLGGFFTLNRLYYAFPGDLYFVAETKHMVFRCRFFVVVLWLPCPITHLATTFEVFETA